MRTRRLMLLFIASLLVHGRSAVAADAVAHEPSLRQVLQRPPALRIFSPSDRVGALAQTQDGLLWIGSSVGLLSYDGRTFDLMAEAEQPRGAVTALGKAKDGSLYVGSSQGLWRRTPDRRFAALTGIDPSITFIATAHDGGVWVATPTRLYRCAEATCESVAIELPSQTQLTCLHAPRQGAPLLVGTNKGVARLINGALVWLWEGSFVHAIEEDDAGKLFIGSEDHGLVAVTEAGEIVPPAAQWRFDTSVLSLRRGASGSLWIGTANGVVERSQGRFMPTISGERLPGVRVLAIVEDDEGNLWLSLDGSGLVQLLRHAPFVAYDTGTDLPLALAATSDGSVWMSHANRVDRWFNSRITSVTMPPDWRVWDLRSIQGDPQGGVWVAGFDASGLIRIAGRDQGLTVTRVPYSPLAPAAISGLHHAGDGRVWVGQRNGDLFARQADGFTALPRGPCQDAITRIHQTRDGTLWVATSGAGLCRFDPKMGTWSRVGTPADHERDITSLASFSDGSLWIGTRSSGLGRVKDGDIRLLGYDQGLRGEMIGGLVEDRGHNIWITSRAGIFRTPLSRLHDVIEGRIKDLRPLLFSTADGLPSSDCISGWADPATLDAEGRLWILTLKGPVMFPGPEAIAKPKLHGPHINNVTINGRSFSAFPSELRAATEQGDLQIDYGAVQLSHGHRLSYRYKLEGFDPNWVDAETRQHAAYTNLRPGRYTFHIAASLKGFDQQATHALRIFLRPPFHRTPTFYVLLVALLMLTGFAGARARVRIVRRRQMLVTEERHRIARDIHDSLEQTFVAMKFQLEAAARSLPEPAAGPIERVASLVRRAASETRAAIWALRADDPRKADLATQVAISAGEAAQGTGIDVRVARVGRAFTLAPDVQRHVVQIVRESVTNALKHAQAKAIDVTITYSPEALIINTKDDGRGFAAKTQNEPAGHYGLVGMRERAKQIRAHLNIESQPGCGTVVTIHVPVTPTTPNPKQPVKT